MLPFSFCCWLHPVFAFNAFASWRTSFPNTMALTVILKALTLLAVAFDFFTPFTGFCELDYFYQFLMLLSYLCIFATHTRAISWANLTNFETITIFFKAMGFLALAPFARFDRSCHFPHCIFELIEIFI